MQACKKGCRHAAFTHFALALVFSAVCAFPLVAQNASAAAQSTFMPVTVPQAPVPPSVTPPVIEGTSVPQLTPSADMHKVPARPETPRAPQLSAASQKMSIPQNPVSPQTPQKPSGTAVAGTSQTSTPNAARSNSARSAAKSAAGNLAGKGAGSSLRNASLSAADISTLSSLLGSGNLFSAQGLGGLLSIPGTISGTPANSGGGALAGILSGQPNAADLYGQNQTAVLLQAVIEKLDALQKTVDLQNSAKGSVAETDTVQAGKQDKQGGRILRFVAGNYNILPSCTAVFISQPETDGSFLLTGDRKYRSANSAAGKIYGETFYFLFKAAGGGTFNAAFTLSQQPENPDSPLYALTRASFLQAVRTGNLVTMRVLAENVQTDLLLDIDFNSREKGR